MSNPWIIATGIFGALGVALGAFGAHGLRSWLPLQKMTIFETAVRYHLLHTLALLGVAILLVYAPRSTYWLTWSARGFSAGIILFSGSLYVYTLADITAMHWFTPLGGLTWILGWFALAMAGWRGTGNQ